MEGADLLTTFQVHVARIFFGLKPRRGTSSRVAQRCWRLTW